MEKRILVGTESFEEVIRDEYYYVDKTLFIKDFLLQHGSVNQITRPRRFGKTLTMSMLKNFFEIGSDPTLFDGLAISKEKELCEQYMGKYPVISISLKGAGKKDYQNAEKAILDEIAREARRFDFLLQSDRLLQDDKEKYQELRYPKDRESLSDSLRMLTELLEKHYQKKVIVLIDEYDVPLDKAYQKEYYEEMIDLIRSLLGNALKTNESLEFGVLTGCLRISKESIFTGFNNLKVYSLSDPRFDAFFGFTEKEVDELLSYYGLLDKKDKIRDWYDGYLFGNTHVYCPWDVLNYCDLLVHDPTKEPENYWANSSGNELVSMLLEEAGMETRRQLEQLMNGETIYKEIHEELTYRDIHDSVDNVWSVLYSTGYLTKTGNRNEDGIELRLPNKEIHSLFASLINQWFKESVLSDNKRLKELYNAVVHGDAETIERVMRIALRQSISIRDTAVMKNRKENFYHGMVVGMLQSINAWDGLLSNAELGEGYCDIAIWATDDLGIVIEIKYAEDGKLEKACDEAIQQIKDKHYMDGMQDSGVKEVIAYGMAFYKKQCVVKLVG